MRWTYCFLVCSLAQGARDLTQNLLNMGCAVAATQHCAGAGAVAGAVGAVAAVAAAETKAVAYGAAQKMVEEAEAAVGRVEELQCSATQALGMKQGHGCGALPP